MYNEDESWHYREERVEVDSLDHAKRYRRDLENTFKGFIFHNWKVVEETYRVKTILDLPEE